MMPDRMAAGIIDRRDRRPDWSGLRFVVRRRGGILDDRLTVAAFLLESRAREFAALLAEENSDHGYFYFVEEVAP